MIYKRFDLVLFFFGIFLDLYSKVSGPATEFKKIAKSGTVIKVPDTREIGLSGNGNNGIKLSKVFIGDFFFF